MFPIFFRAEDTQTDGIADHHQGEPQNELASLQRAVLARHVRPYTRNVSVDPALPQILLQSAVPYPCEGICKHCRGSEIGAILWTKRVQVVRTWSQRRVVSKNQVSIVHREPQNAHIVRHWTLREVLVEALLSHEYHCPPIAYKLETLLRRVKDILT